MNVLSGTLIRSSTNGSITKMVIRVDETVITAVLIDFTDKVIRPLEGSRITVLFKETETALSHPLPPGVLSIRNRIPCTITAVEDDGILAQVHLAFAGAIIRAIITSESAGELRLAPGMSIFALIKSTEVMVEEEPV
jgi:molybdate transport system regulatory protein